MSTAQIPGFFTFGVAPDQFKLPHPPIELPIILLVRRVLLRAFERLRERRYPLATELEDRITERLFNVIENDLRQSGEVAGFTTRTYDRVVRHAQVTNYTGEKLAKTPDLSFKLRNYDQEPRPVLSSHDALFVECKPVDKDHPAGGDYCDKGLLRFVDGDYAWTMEQALMIGYARQGRTIEKHLIPAMRETRRRTALKVIELPTSHGRATTVCEALHISKHQRGFPWPHGKGAATDIVVYHSWHCCE